LRTSLVSIDNNRWAPPRKSRPRLSCLVGTKLGQWASVSLEKKLGRTNRTPMRQVMMTAACFMGVKCIGLTHSFLDRGPGSRGQYSGRVPNLVTGPADRT